MGPAPAGVQSVEKFSSKKWCRAANKFYQALKAQTLSKPGSIAVQAGHDPGDVLSWATEWSPSSESFLRWPSAPWILLLSGFWVSRAILSDWLTFVLRREGSKMREEGACSSLKSFSAGSFSIEEPSWLHLAKGWLRMAGELAPPKSRRDFLPLA